MFVADSPISDFKRNPAFIREECWYQELAGRDHWSIFIENRVYRSKKALYVDGNAGNDRACRMYILLTVTEVDLLVCSAFLHLRLEHFCRRLIVLTTIPYTWK